MKFNILAVVLLVLSSASYAADETVVTQKDTKSLSVTIYNHGTGLVKDTRSVKMTAGNNTISFSGISAGNLDGNPFGAFRAGF